MTFRELVKDMPLLTEEEVRTIQLDNVCIKCHSYPLDRNDCNITQMSYYRCRQCTGLFLTPKLF